VSARSKARKQTLDLLYEADIRGTSAAELLALRDVDEEGPDSKPIREFTKVLVSADLDTIGLMVDMDKSGLLKWLEAEKFLLRKTINN